MILSHSRFVFCFTLSLIASFPLLAADGIIYQAAYRLKLTADEKIPYRDYYISVGSRQGVQSGDILEVVRPLSPANALWGGVSPLIEVVMGEVQVLAVSPTGSLVRMTKKSPSENFACIAIRSFYDRRLGAYKDLVCQATRSFRRMRIA